MFVSVMSDIDVQLSKVQNLLIDVNMKLSKCPELSRNHVLSRAQTILDEMQWMVSLSQELTCESDECRSDASLEWDNFQDNKFYQTVFIDPEETTLDDDHGQSSESTEVSSETSSVPSTAEDSDEVLSQASSNNNNNKASIFFKMKVKNPKFIAPKTFPLFSCSSDDEEDESKMECSAVPDNEDDGRKFVSMMTTSIQKLAPSSTYHVIRPKKYKVDLSQVNSRFLSNIPRPKEHPVLGCMTEEEAKAHVNRYRIWKPEWKWGFMTDCGIVPVPEEPVYGHVWSPSYREWILHAIPDDGSGPPPPRHRGGRFRG